MPRMNLTKDFKGFKYVTSESFNLPDGAANLFNAETGKINLSLMPSVADLGLDLSNYVSANGVKLTSTKANGAVEFVAGTATNLKLNQDGSIILNGNTQNTAGGLVVLGATSGKIPVATENYTAVVVADTNSGLSGVGTVASPLKVDLTDYQAESIRIYAEGSPLSGGNNNPKIELSVSSDGINSDAYITLNGSTLSVAHEIGVVSITGMSVSISSDGALSLFGLNDVSIDSGMSNVTIGNALKVSGSGEGTTYVQIKAGTAFVDLLGSDNKLNTALIPDLAITDVYTLAVTSSNYTAGTTTVTDLVKSAITAAGVQKGDVVILTASDKAIADAVAGTYIFVADVAAKANITSANYVKMYAPDGTVISVNSIAPVAGNVTINIADVGNVTGVTSFTASTVSDVTTISVNGIALAKQADVNAINAKQVQQLAEATITLAGTTVSGMTASVTETKDPSDNTTVINRTATVTVTGKVICVYDGDGKQIYPDATYNKSTGITTLVADYGLETVDTSWDVTYTKLVTISGLTASN